MAVTQTMRKSKCCISTHIKNGRQCKAKSGSLTMTMWCLKWQLLLWWFSLGSVGSFLVSPSVAVVGCVAGFLATTCRVALIENLKHHACSVDSCYLLVTSNQTPSKLYQLLPSCGVRNEVSVVTAVTDGVILAEQWGNFQTRQLHALIPGTVLLAVYQVSLPCLKHQLPLSLDGTASDVAYFLNWMKYHC